VLAASNKLDEAEKHYRAALRFMPDLAEAHGNLGNVLVLANKIEDAKKEYTEALRLNPNIESVRKTLEMINKAAPSG
jgi:tetratricopeptide (TPR) repeat protein